MVRKRFLLMYHFNDLRNNKCNISIKKIFNVKTRMKGKLKSVYFLVKGATGLKENHRYICIYPILLHMINPYMGSDLD